MSKRLRTRQEDGFTMILVIGVGILMLAFAFAAAGGSVNVARSSGLHVIFGQSLDAAEAGIDQLQARLQQVNGAYTYCPTTTNVTTCDTPSNTWVSGFPLVPNSDPTSEAAWAKTTLRQLAADNQGLLQTTATGQYLAIKPAHLNTVYSMSWVPNYAQVKRQRLLKAEYIFSTYHPSNAILTNGDITCCASYQVGNAPGITGVIGIHTNGSMTSVPTPANGETVQVTASGTGPNAGSSNTPIQTVPAINPRTIYNNLSGSYSAAWYDLCPDNTFRSPNTATSATPCTGTILQSGGTFRGWSKSSSGTTWDPTGGNYPGVYYVYRGNIHVGSPHTVTLSAATTLITEATANRACPKTDGDITLDNKSSWTGGWYIPGLMVVAGGNFYQNNQAVSSPPGGAYLAQGSVNQHTSAHDALYGLMIAEDFCGETNDLQGSVLFYDGGEDLPLAPLIRTTLELELT